MNAFANPGGSSSPRNGRSPDPRRGGFTAPEALAVLAVLGVLGAVVATGVLGRIRSAHREAEHTSLRTLAAGLREHVARSKGLPATDEWASGVAGQLWVESERVTRTGSGGSRWLVYDPELRMGPSGERMPPFHQTSEGTVRPARLRLVIVSGRAGSSPPARVDAATFERWWDAAAQPVPGGGGPSGCGSLGDWHVLREDLSGLFHRVVIENRDPSRPAVYSVDAHPAVSVPAGERREFWLIETSTLDLRGPEGELAARERVAGSMERVFETGSWRPASPDRKWTALDGADPQSGGAVAGDGTASRGGS